MCIRDSRHASSGEGIDYDHAVGFTPITMAANKRHGSVVRLLAHLGARLRMPDGHGFWVFYESDDPRRHEMQQFWPGIINAGGDEPTEESRRLRRRLLVQAKMHDPRDGGPDEEPMECARMTLARFSNGPRTAHSQP